MGGFYEYTEQNDPLDDPRYEAEYNQEIQDYWEELDDKQRKGE